MTDPIPVSLARLALKRLIRECDAATYLPSGPVAATRGLAELALSAVEFHMAMEKDSLPPGPAADCLRPLIDHYDATAPGWREEKEE